MTPTPGRSLLFFLLSFVVCNWIQAAEWRPLFNGRDLSGWDSWLARPTASWDVPGMTRGADGKYSEAIGLNHDPLRVFTVESVDGQPAIHVSGQGFGVISTRESFSNYRLRVQFKWGERRWAPREGVARDAGLLYHVYGEGGAFDSTWPLSSELQIQEGDCGDLWTVGTKAIVRARPKQGKEFAVYDPSRPPIEIINWESANSSRCIKLADHEKPRGEWNTVEVICVGAQVIHIVNGVVVLRLDEVLARQGDGWTPLSSGRVALQTEGAEIYYRGIEVTPLDEIPAEFR